MKRTQYAAVRCYLQEGGGFRAAAVFEWCEDVGTSELTEHKQRGDSEIRATPGEAMAEALKRSGFYDA